MNSKQGRKVLEDLQTHLRSALEHLKNLVGYNIATVCFIKDFEAVPSSKLVIGAEDEDTNHITKYRQQLSESHSDQPRKKRRAKG